MSKTRKALLSVTIAIACAAALGLAACGSGASSASSASVSASAAADVSSASAATSAATSTASAATSTASAAASSAAASSGATTSESAGAATPASPSTELTADELASVDITIELDDYDAMHALAKDIQNGRATGEVVKIDGYVSNFAKGMSYSIVENRPDGSGNIGTVFVIEDADEDEYPSDGTHVILTGKVVSNGSVSFNIHTLSEFVEVV